jgi:hypothetical protein
VSRPKPWLLGVFICLLSSIGPVLSAPKVDGRIALRSLYSTANGPVSRDVIYNFLDLDFEGQHLNSWDTGLILDSIFLWDITEVNERRFGETESFQRIHQLYISQPLSENSWTLSVGRRVIPEAGNAWVDGLDLRLALDANIRLGVYGGLRPQPANYRPTTDYQTLGVYGIYRRSGITADIGYNVIIRDGLDRQFIFGRAHYRIVPSLYFSLYSVIDTLDEVEATTILGTVDYSPKKRLNLSLNYTRYSVEAYRNQGIYQNVTQLNQVLILGDEVIDLVYNRARLSVSYRFWRRFYHYQSVEYKRRSQDRRESWAYTIGIRNSDLMGWGTRLDARAIFRNNFQSDSWVLATDVEHDLSSGLTLNGHATIFDGRTIDRFTERGRTFDEAQRIYLVGGALFWRPVRAHHLSMAYDGAYETDLKDQRNEAALFIHTLMARYAYYY